MVFGRRVIGSSGGGGGRPLSPEAGRLADAMRAIFVVAVNVASALRNGASLPVVARGESMYAPIPCKDSAKLFEQVNEKGETLFAFYHSTIDFKVLDPEAQRKLSDLYQRIYSANTLINGLTGWSDKERIASLKMLLDQILVKSAFYIAFFESTPLSMEILSGQRSRETISQAIAAHAENCKARMDEARRNMFEPAAIADLAPETHPGIAVAATYRYQEGQKTINGVYFPPEYAKLLMRKAAIDQAGAMRDRA